MNFLTLWFPLIGTGFLSLSFWLWCVAGLAFAFMLRSVYSALSWLWRLPERMPKIDGLSLLKPGEPERFLEPPKKLTATQAAKMMLLAAVILGAYKVGTEINYSREYRAWKQRAANYDRDHAAFQEAVAKWKAKQKENR